MSSAYEATGRTGQKQRTRNALVSAARDLVSAGTTPSIEQTAAAAGVSRAAAYRYFPNQRALLAAAHPETVAGSLLPSDPPIDAAARLDLVMRGFARLIADTEPQQRTMLRLSLHAEGDRPPQLPLRQGRAIGWIAEALAPLGGELPDHAIEQLVLAIRSAGGIEALVWLTDVAGLSRHNAANLMCWSAQALLHAALTMTPPPVPTP